MHDAIKTIQKKDDSRLDQNKTGILKVDLKRFTNEIGLQYIRKTKNDITISLSKKLFCAIQ